MSVREHWPNWGSISQATNQAPQQLQYTIRMSRNYCELSDHISDPQGFFDETCAIINEIRKNKGPGHEETLVKDLEDGLMSLVFTSNNIERAGLSLQETVKICRKIFGGEDVKAEDIAEESEEYTAALQSLISAQICQPSNASRTHVIQSRREVVQHAKALDYITRAMAIHNQPLTEDLIKATHRILMIGTDREDTGYGYGTTPWQKYAEVYRHIPVHAGNTSFVVPKHIPRKMQELVDKFNADVREAEETLVIDPFHLAAKYSNMFALIHPFLDGNGRTCRLILNAILFRYTGTVVAFGEDDEARAEYFEIVKRADEDVRDDQPEFAAYVLGKASLRLRHLKQKLEEVMVFKGGAN